MRTLDKIYYQLYNAYGPQAWWPADNDIEMMIGAVLVQNTNWSNVEKALANFNHFDGNVILKISYEELMEIVRPAGFYKRKAQTVSNLLKWYEAYDFNVEKVKDIQTELLRKELLSINGIGEETCDCILLYAFNRPVFVVDAYLRRLLLKTGHPEMKTYSEIQTYMMEVLPNDTKIFQEYHALIVEYGKIFLKPNAKPDEADPLLKSVHTINYTLQELETISDNKTMKELINSFGFVERSAYSDPYWGIIYAIVGQLISTSAAKAIMTRFEKAFVDRSVLCNASIDEIKSVGLTKAKANYIKNIALKVEANELDLESIWSMTTEQAIKYLCEIKGIGIWSAKIILMHSYNNLDLAIYEDVALRNAVKKRLDIDDISREEFDAYFEQFAPYKTIACIYHWYFIAHD